MISTMKIHLGKDDKCEKTPDKFEKIGIGKM